MLSIKRKYHKNGMISKCHKAIMLKKQSRMGHFVGKTKAGNACPFVISWEKCTMGTRDELECYVVIACINMVCIFHK